MQRSDREAGIVGLILLGLIVLVLAGAAFVFVARKQKDQPTQSSTTRTTQPSSEGGSSLAVNSRNTQRRVDAITLLSATAEYISNNNGQLPTEVTYDMIVELKAYNSVGFLVGEQAPVADDRLSFVVSATCVSGGGTASGSSRQYAVQYGVEQTDGSYKPECKEG